MQRRTLLKAGLVSAPAALAATALPSPAEARPRYAGTLASGLSFPWGLDFLPDGSALVGERNSGRILHVRRNASARVVGTVPGVYNDGGEGGLLGLALSPTYARDHWLYGFMTTRVDNRIVRMQYDADTLGPPEIILSGIPSGSRHNGGGLWFTSYPSLYATTGDTQDRSLPQNRSSLAGKVLRMRMDGSPQGGNPFGTHVFSLGHRNPEGVTMGDDGRLWVSELGENTWDELNRVLPGRNYGWPRTEGGDGSGGYSDPLARWHPSVCSPSGVATLYGRAWVGALRGQCLWSVDILGSGRGRKVRYFHGSFGRIRNVVRAPDRSLWITTSNGPGQDRVVRVAFG